MATDGIKIIDGDLAHDTYEYIMELYDNGASAEIIKKENSIHKRRIMEMKRIFITKFLLQLTPWHFGKSEN